MARRLWLKGHLGCHGLSVSTHQAEADEHLSFVGCSVGFVLHGAVVDATSAATNPQGHTEAFWGFDRVGQVIDHLGLERPDDGSWRAML